MKFKDPVQGPLEKKQKTILKQHQGLKPRLPNQSGSLDKPAATSNRS
jgi:hypothetical protein